MPKSTFFNLSEDKRERIMEASIDEFAEYSYHNGSINRIVESAGIAKGSFYQYFEDKKDIFKYILEISAEKKLIYLAHIMKEMPKMDFFEVTRELYIAGLRFAKERPKLSAIANDFVKNSDSKLKEEILGENVHKSNRIFQDLLTKGIEEGEIDSSIDVELISHIITSLSISVSEYFIKEIKEEDDDEIMVLIDKMLAFIKDGIRSKKSINRNTGRGIEDRFY